ncbi:MAG: 4'-phosphopantetheinyl transferase family protein [Bacteroidales bacterium]
MPIVRENIAENGCRWAIWHITESVDELLSSSINTAIHEKAIAKFPHERRKLEYLTTRLLVEHLTNSNIEILYHSNGKPYLADQSFQLSLTHTVGYAAAIIHPTTPVGIDVETVSPRILKIKERFLSVNELENIDAQDEVKHLLLHWSAKESVFKAMGKEEVDFRDHLHIEPFSPKCEGQFILNETRTVNQKSYRINYLSNDEFVLTWTF